MLAQVFREQTEHQRPCVGVDEERKQQFHQPGRGAASAFRANPKRKRDKGIEILLLGKLLLVAWHPPHRNGPSNRDARFIHGDFSKRRIVTGSFQGYESPKAMTNEQGRAGLLLQGDHILTLFADAVIIALWTAQASSAPLDDVNRKMLAQRGRGLS